MYPAVDSATSIAASPAPERLSPAEAWHLLSLDAPSVAALWAWFFARTMRVGLPWHAPLLLGLGTWLIYVADRLLDGFLRKPEVPLRLRHRFHARHRGAFLSAAGVVSGVLLWLIVEKMHPAARREDTVLFLLSLLYLFVVHRPAGASRSWLPKELAVGIVFAAAAAVPTWSRADSGRLAMLPAVALFAALCWLNCIAIERWENEFTPEGLAISNPTTRWTAEHLRGMAITLASLSVSMGSVALAKSSSTAAVYFAVLSSSVILVAIHNARRRLTFLGLRIAADAALLTPLLLLPFMAR